eukprot:CAMPEP_0185776188 /NCGR_PEP_ID=MMETSP1174-20130828/84830_1 /TAXON_ID=35687 /ORGANISM="Dictyocha speculum, Strain CCMP1381" /LENGTH=41 /DNA_ID= /DNA_START= /DNA_END= /DNA_ORIENTATION=
MILMWTNEISEHMVSMMGNSLAFSSLPLRDVVEEMRKVVVK